ncbi:hypothetical protein BVG16_25240 [Paenibacillus selenitireducens]|uniref:Family 10 glycosylhydrolase n=1 Tax=Paenibacillus selenitireducens TaxID=1324314 RepID=A0A1T2X2H6_9BACL|nr:hypothetical protein BVG16_25240 [Paenibacillus selenitireducens]
MLTEQSNSDPQIIEQSMPTGEAARLEIEPSPVVIPTHSTQTFTAKGFDTNAKELEVPQDQINWSIKSDSVPGIGTLVDGTLTTGDQPATGVIEAVYNGITAEVNVIVEAPSLMASANTAWTQVFEDFEDIGDVRVTSVQSNSAVLTQSERPAPVKYGFKAGKLEYDFTGTGGTSAAYIRFKNAEGKDGREIAGKPKKIGFWVYGEDKKHWIRGQVQDQLGGQFTLDFTGSSEVLNGWRYVTADIPSSNFPIKLNYIYLVETSNKTSGTLYVDQVSAVYENTDMFGLEWAGVMPMGVGESLQAQVLVTRKGYAEPQLVDGNVTYTSSNENVATIDTMGRIKAVGTGETELTATYNTFSTIYRLVVSDQSVLPDALQMEGPASLVLTETAKLKAFAIFGTNEPVDVSSDTVFTGEEGSPVAVVTGQTIQAKAIGAMNITANYKGRKHSYTVQVKAGELKSIEIANVFSVIIGGDSVKAKVFGDYKIEGKKEIPSGAAFTSANPAIATIDSLTGEVKAVSPGTTLITATVEGKTAQQLVVVTNPPAHPKRELRGAWIATVENIDWPTKNVFDPEQQRQDFIRLIDQLHDTGINAVFVQVRPTSDSFFPSKYFPWSHWLTGEQGKAPSDGYDPLKFMIEETHKRNIEFHAWINPYRISMHDNPNLLAPNHPARLHPDWVVANGGKLYFNPGVAEAKDYIINGVKEIVENYDVDGIHMDDYFYPYPGNEPFNDSKQYDAYKTNGGTMNLQDWRRDNVNSIVKGLHTGVKQIKPYVKFGISPFGIWRNKGTDPTGSDTAGQENYDGLFADTRTWMKEGWVDYLAPQIYWHFGYSAAAYEKLMDWWTKEINGQNDGSGKHDIHLYIGQGAYRVGEDNWKNPDQLPAQLRFNNDYGDKVSGNILFSSSDVLANPLGVRDAIASMYARPALIPVMPWIKGDVPNAPEIVGLSEVSGAKQLSWKDSGSSQPTYYAVYRASGLEAPDVNNTANLLDTVRRAEGPIQTYTDNTAVPGQVYTYAVTAVSRLHVESVMSNTISEPTTSPSLLGIELGELTSMIIPQTQQVHVFGTNVFGDKEELTSGIAFQSSDAKVASISVSGLITAHAAGITTITATYQGFSATYSLSVFASPIQELKLNPLTDMSVGNTQQVTVSAVHENGEEEVLTSGVEFTSTQPTVASISLNGLITAHTAGITTITAAYQGFSATYSLSVLASPIQELKLNPLTSMNVGNTQQVTVSAVHESGQEEVLTSDVAFTSTEPAIASISESGLITAHAAGVTTITATYQGFSATYSLSVLASPIQELKLNPLTSMTVGNTQQVTVSAVHENGQEEVLTSGVTFTSTEPAIASISESGLIKALAPGTTVITAAYQGKSVSYTLTVQSQPTTNPGPGTSNSNPAPSTPAAPKPKPSDVYTVTEKELMNAPDGKLNISAGAGKTQVQLPGNVAERLGKQGTVHLDFDGMAVSIPISVLQEAVKQAQLTSTVDVQIGVALKRLDTVQITNLMTDLQKQSDAIVSGEQIVTLQIFVLSKDGTKTELKTFKQPITLTLPIPKTAKASRVGIYGIDEQKRIQYVGGTITEGNRITTDVSQSGQYGAMSYDKSFTDVDSRHWAEQVIKDMAARHVIKGLPDGTFSPNKEVTRGEFVSLLVRLMKLPTGEDTPFADVETNDWFAGEVSAAAKAGFIHRSNDGLFHPNAAITREEMAVLLMNAYKASGMKELEDMPHAAFRDQANISDWAQQSIDEAVSLGLLRGSGQHMFHPANPLTRAESAQVLANLLEKWKN